MYFFLRITTVLDTTTLKHQIPHLFAVLRFKYIKSDMSITGLEISGILRRAPRFLRLGGRQAPAKNG